MPCAYKKDHWYSSTLPLSNNACHLTTSENLHLSSCGPKVNIGMTGDVRGIHMEIRQFAQCKQTKKRYFTNSSWLGNTWILGKRDSLLVDTKPLSDILEFSIYESIENVAEVICCMMAAILIHEKRMSYATFQWLETGPCPYITVDTMLCCARPW